jgi:predicted SAM-dependent methyltransferase
MDLARYRNLRGQIWLNVASSIYPLEGFVNLDSDIRLRIGPIFPILRPFIPGRYHRWIQAYRRERQDNIFLVHDCRRPLPFPKGSVDHILCSHFLEHLYPDEASTLLRDFYAKLRAGGTVDIIVSDLEVLAENYVKKASKGAVDATGVFFSTTMLSRPTRGSFRYRFLEFLGGFGLQHRWMYDTAAMRACMEEAGFKIRLENDTPSRFFRYEPPGTRGAVRLVGERG